MKYLKQKRAVSSSSSHSSILSNEQTRINEPSKAWSHSFAVEKRAPCSGGTSQTPDQRPSPEETRNRQNWAENGERTPSEWESTRHATPLPPP